MLGRVKAKAAAAGGKAKSGKDAGVAKLLNTINKLRPVLRAGGYAIDGVELTVGLPPSALLSLQNVAEVNMEELDALENRSDPPLTRLQKGVVRMLKRVEQLETTVEAKQYHVDKILMETGLIPKLTLCLVPMDPSPAGDDAAAALDGDVLSDSELDAGASDA